MNKNSLLNYNYICPMGADGVQSKHLGLLSLFLNGGCSCSWINVKPLVVDGSSGDFGWSVFVSALAADQDQRMIAASPRSETARTKVS